MFLTPHTTSAMAMFGFVYLWYLMAVLVLEIWLDYRKDIVLMARQSSGRMRQLYRAMALWSDNISERSLEIDDKVGRFITIVGIPSAFLLHGTSVSSSARSRPTPGGLPPSCRWSSSFPPWCRASPW